MSASRPLKPVAVTASFSFVVAAPSGMTVSSDVDTPAPHARGSHPSPSWTTRAATLPLTTLRKPLPQK
ncbi:hypothetical protein LX15_005923 [Streptoalloteichus tenebrarius]|uniref:Secreted protein n=1 Tax=Streptoalloteichus tenebrarius (strain ATCC 17920 / DSM 40477 / JCM 4838 / CBS 697.72 / NBRC 16177 / NCIMB 11028 / NRRL B-12390 / A12253. 1 / ISP 5477) TaxID=1933 RepID=A0ABT1I349_STRSD|nr:hypothetical protein [Streptoalloteichus tenebrarius]